MPSEYTWHVPRVHKRVLKLVNFEVQKVQKPELFDLVDTSPWLRGGHWPLGHVSHSGANFVSKEMPGDNCDGRPAFGLSWTEFVYHGCWHFDNDVTSNIDEVITEHGVRLHVLPLAVNLTSREDHCETFLLFEYCWGTPPSSFKVIGWLWPTGF